MRVAYAWDDVGAGAVTLQRALRDMALADVEREHGPGWSVYEAKVYGGTFDPDAQSGLFVVRLERPDEVTA